MFIFKKNDSVWKTSGAGNHTFISTELASILYVFINGMYSSDNGKLYYPTDFNWFNADT